MKPKKGQLIKWKFMWRKLEWERGEDIYAGGDMIKNKYGISIYITHWRRPGENVWRSIDE